MKYKVGDKVIVRSWDDMAREYRIDDVGDIRTNKFYFLKSMKEFCGTTVTIKRIDTLGIYCNIEEDYGKNVWTEDMFVDYLYIPNSIDFTKSTNCDLLTDLRKTINNLKEKNEMKTVEEKKQPKQRDKDHFDRVRKLEEKIAYYSGMSGFEKIEEVVPGKVLVVEFVEEYDEKFECKMICDNQDKFSIEDALYIALAKRNGYDTYTPEGIEELAKQYKLYKNKVAAVKYGLKLIDTQKALEEENKEYEKLLEHRRKKRWTKKQKRAEKKREEQIQIQTEAILRATKQLGCCSITTDTCDSER